MIFRQTLHPATGCASYVFGCLGKKRLAVVDAHSLHLADYLAVAGSAGSSIVAILETHVQADHRSGALELAHQTGAKVYLHETADVAFPFTALGDGDEVPLGNDYIRVMHTPGHSPESSCLLVGDRTRGEDPWVVLTGDTLLVGDAGRPDLDENASRDAAEDATRQLHHSLERLLSLPDHLEVYPGHFSGSACGRSLSAKPSSTIGFERRFNAALQPRSADEFVDFMLADVPPPPQDHMAIRRANRLSAAAPSPTPAT
jgi:glyoxylase-like metal-dependent hydrolase (beta-lactamase superfamily II)